MTQTDTDPAGIAEKAPAASPRPTLVQALLVLVGVIVAIAGYIALTTALGIREAYVGYIFVFWWLSLEQGKLQRVPAILLGSGFGLAAGWLLQYATHPLQPLLLVVFLVAVGVSIVSLVLARLPVVFNTPAMLFLTVFTIPHIQQAANFPQLYLALAFAAVFFVALVTGLTKLATRLKPR